MVVNPVTISPDAKLADLKALMAEHRVSGIPVVEGATKKKPGKLVGIITNRDVRFADDPNEKVGNLMTRNVVTVKQGASQAEARAKLHEHRIERVLVVDEQNRCVGLITVKDMEKAEAHPMAAKDEHGRLRCAAASTVGDSGFERAEGADRCRCRRDCDRHGARPEPVRARPGHAREEGDKCDPHRCRQCGDL